MNKNKTSKFVSVEDQGIKNLGTVYYNLNEIELMEHALKRSEGHLGKGGSLIVYTGEKTGRSPTDKHIVLEENNSQKIWWENNKSISPEHFQILFNDLSNHMKGKSYYAQDLTAGKDTNSVLNVRVITELAWHNLFIRHLLKIPKNDYLNSFIPEYTIINCPSFLSDPRKHGCQSETTIAISFEKKLILICGTGYAGENKKSVFTLLNYLLPEKKVMPMHCSANHAISDEDDVALFFGLSGTGKTTLSADPNRILIGDDEHGWSDNGVFNFEGGCYAKTINLKAEEEPEIYATTEKFSTVIENMHFNTSDRTLDFYNDSITQNMRCAYPISYIKNSSKTGFGGAPKNIIMLTCDAFGVLPPIAKLSSAEAVFYFLSGFTAKVAGTEQGVTEPQPTFSTCFGAPFMPLKPEVYGQILWDRLENKKPNCWLLNTGWSGGGFGEGERISIVNTRKILRAILDKDTKLETKTDKFFNFSIPTSIEDLPDKLLTPRETWQDIEKYDAVAYNLRDMFVKNFQKFSFVNNEVNEVYKNLTDG
jgi:phosphoenolpyruvate carboxykinase (ATP)